MALHCQVSTWMGDRMYAGKPSQSVTGHLDQFSLLSTRGNNRVLASGWGWG